MTMQSTYAVPFFKRLAKDGGGGLGAADFAALSASMLEIALAVHGEGQGGAARWGRLVKELTARGLDALVEEISKAEDVDLAALRNGAGWLAFDLCDVMSEDLPPAVWLVKPYVSKPSVTAWFGKPKSLKSLLVLDMVLHVAGGLAWLCNPQGGDGLPVTAARVVWVDLENGANTFKRRMKAIATALGMGKARGQVLAFSMPTPWPDLGQDEHVTALIERIQALGDPGVLVIDHLGQVLGEVDENSPLMAKIMGNIRRIAEACNVAIILIHHAKKGQGKDGGDLADSLRGHGGILANVDGAFLIERDKVDRTNVKIIPVAVRGPDVPNVSAQFSYEQDSNLELSAARFWRLTWRSDFARAKDAIFNALRADKTLNYTKLCAAAKFLESGLSDQNIRNAIATLEGTKEITYTAGKNNSKIYRLAEGSENDE